MAYEIIHPRRERRHDLRQREQQAGEALTLTGAQFRRWLGWGKDRFYAAAKSGRFAHLVALNASSRHRVLYNRAKAEAWASETASPRPLHTAGARS